MPHGLKGVYYKIVVSIGMKQAPLNKSILIATLFIFLKLALQHSPYMISKYGLRKCIKIYNIISYLS